jgi:hypothetical protein
MSIHSPAIFLGSPSEPISVLDTKDSMRYSMTGLLRMKFDLTPGAPAGRDQLPALLAIEAVATDLFFFKLHHVLLPHSSTGEQVEQGMSETPSWFSPPPHLL